MAKLDGMDPKLVRELLREVQQAGREMQDVEARVTGLMRQAGVAAHVTYRPVQVADECTSMVKDVTGRLTLLEKKEKQRSGNGKPTEDKGQKFHQEPDITMPADDPKPEAHKSDGTKADHKPDQKADHKPEKTDHKADHKPDKADGKADDHRAGDKTGNGTKHSGTSTGGTPHTAAPATHSAADDATPAKTGDKSQRVVEGSLSQPPRSGGETAHAGPPTGPAPEQPTGHANGQPTGQPTGHPVGQPAGQADGQPTGRPNGQQPDPQASRPGDPNAHGTGANGVTSPATGAGTGDPAGGASAPGGGTATCQCGGVCHCGMTNGTGTTAANGTGTTAANGTGTGGGVPTTTPGTATTGTATTGTTAGVADASYTGAGQGTTPQAPGVGVTNDAAAATGAANTAGTVHTVQDASGTGGVPVGNDSQIIDTLGKDHPDDVDQTAGRRVIVVDGVKVVSTPMNQPGIMDAPSAGAQPAHTVAGPHPDGPPGIVEPGRPAHSSDAANAGTATTGTGHVGGGDAGQTGSAQTGPGKADSGQAASGPAISGSVQSDHTPVQPSQAPGQSGQTSSHPGLAPGDPMGDYVGTPADNLTEDPFAAGGTDSVPGTPEDQDDRVQDRHSQGDPPADGGGTRHDANSGRPMVVEVHLETSPDDAAVPGDSAQREVRL
ncbi:hypothetical protein ACQP1K_07180 [Sphaerimonospora sp. CA-214678]|uniref:hypothetical protein n=1 Tax=Sphaerimonospora sp. CA-214678 TaxID=3240029 RepID=UPI003D8BB5EF